MRCVERLSLLRQLHYLDQLSIHHCDNTEPRIYEQKVDKKAEERRKILLRQYEKGKKIADWIVKIILPA